jgi:guanine deaminase
MDQHSPADYCHDTEQNLRETNEFIHYIKSTRNYEYERGLLFPVVTPRFLPTCSASLLAGLGEIAKKHNNCHIQSHISESIDEVAFSRQLDMDNNINVNHGGGRSDTEIFDSHKLLNSKTIMAHGNWVGLGRDCTTLRERGSAIAHCPLSNFFFAGAPFPSVEYLRRGNKVGLGTDVAGGYSPSILNAMRNAVITSHTLEHCRYYHNTAAAALSDTHTSNEEAPSAPSTKTVISDSDSDSDDIRMDYRQAFYLATLGGATALGLEHDIGTFAVGMKFDALVMSCGVGDDNTTTGNIDIFEHDSTSDAFQKLCNLGDSRNIKRIFVQGREVSSSNQ